MRKEIIGEPRGGADRSRDSWIDVERVARAELTSEDPAYPIEAALGEHGSGWRAASPGSQLVRLVFDAPLDVRRVVVEFAADGEERTQEFVLRWSSAVDEPAREIVRQQWNFHAGCAREVEDYDVRLSGVRVLEVEVTPDVSGGPWLASLARLRVA